MSRGIIERYGEKSVNGSSLGQDTDASVALLKSKIAEVDISECAQRLGAEFSDNRLTIKCLGKDISVDNYE